MTELDKTLFLLVHKTISWNQSYDGDWYWGTIYYDPNDNYKYQCYCYNNTWTSNFDGKINEHSQPSQLTMNHTSQEEALNQCVIHWINYKND